MSTHTPGPWAVSGVQITCPSLSHAGQSARIATVSHSAQCHPQVRRQASANARLIAAAPEMLAFIRAIATDDHDGFCEKQGSEFGKPCICRKAPARALLARIEGTNG